MGDSVSRTELEKEGVEQTEDAVTENAEGHACTYDARLHIYMPPCAEHNCEICVKCWSELCHNSLN